MRSSEPIVAHTGMHQRQIGVALTEKNGRFEKWSAALGQLINMVKWAMEDARSASVHMGRRFALRVARKQGK